MKKTNNKNPGNRISEILLNLVVWFFGLVILLPFVWMICSSFKTTEEIFRPAKILPESLDLSNYNLLFSNWPFSSWFLNSIFVAAFTTIGALIITAMAGYAFNKYRFKGKKQFFAGFMISTMIPFPILAVPLFVIVSRLGLTNSLFSLILPLLAPPVGIFLMNQYAEYVPGPLLDSARIDGAGEFSIFFKIALPIMKPGLASLGIITFVNSWNNFLWPLVAIRKQEVMTLPVGLANMLKSVSAGSAPPYGPAMAASTLICIPTIAVFMAVQKYYVRGLTAGAIK